MIKYVCDTCGAELSTRRTLLKIATVSEIFGTETALCSSEYDLCEECARRIRGAAERHCWTEPTEEEPVKEAAKEEPAEDIVPAEEQKKKKTGQEGEGCQRGSRKDRRAEERRLAGKGDLRGDARVSGDGIQSPEDGEGRGSRDGAV